MTSAVVTRGEVRPLNTETSDLHVPVKHVLD